MASKGRQRGRVLVVTIDRPERTNAIDLATGRQLSAAFDDLERDGDVGAVVLTGTGEHASKRVARAGLDAGEAPAWKLSDELTAALTVTRCAETAEAARRRRASVGSSQCWTR